MSEPASQLEGVLDVPIEDIVFTADPEPVPEQKKSRPRGGSQRGPGRPSKESVENADVAELQEQIEGFLSIIGMGLSFRDRHADGTSCADLYLQYNAETGEMRVTPDARAFASAFAAVGINNKYIKAFFGSSDGLSKYTTLALAANALIMPMIQTHRRGQEPEYNADVTSQYS